MKLLKETLFIFFLMSLILGLAYPLAMTGLARIAFPDASRGSLVSSGGRVIGSALIGQKFASPRYFHGRPSSVNFDAAGSGGSNLGPTNKKLIEATSKAAESVRRKNGLPAGAAVPADLALASASGLDPHISLEGALVQVARVARERKRSAEEIGALAKSKIERRYIGLIGDKFVNVLRLNIALDEMVKE